MRRFCYKNFLKLNLIMARIDANVKCYLAGFDFSRPFLLNILKQMPARAPRRMESAVFGKKGIP